jgi:hypothetical protein
VMMAPVAATAAMMAAPVIVGAAITAKVSHSCLLFVYESMFCYYFLVMRLFADNCERLSFLVVCFVLLVSCFTGLF